MDNIKWGPKRECTGDRPCPDWVLVRINRRSGSYWSNPLPAENVDWGRAVEYRLPAEYEALVNAKEPTHEQMRETLATKYQGIPDMLVEIDPVVAIYDGLNPCVGWKVLSPLVKEQYRAVFEAGKKFAENDAAKETENDQTI